MDARCLACDDTTCAFRPLVIQRRAVGPKDILIQIKFCGVCASDLWTARSGQSVGCRTAFPFVPGHEIAGVVAAVGADVEAFAVGDRVGVGCLVDSCQACGACDARDEHRCPGQVMTYASPDRHGRCGGSTPQTADGYADRVVVQERFAIAIPAALPLEAAGPLMCAGTTAYAPLKRYGAGEGTRVGVVGLGGVGAMAVKLAKALGCEVTAISRSKKKAAAYEKAEAAKRAKDGPEGTVVKAPRRLLPRCTKRRFGGEFWDLLVFGLFAGALGGHAARRRSEDRAFPFLAGQYYAVHLASALCASVLALLDRRARHASLALLLAPSRYVNLSLIHI